MKVPALWDEDLTGVVRAQAFRHLLAAGDSATGEDLAAAIGLASDKVARVLEELNTAGRIRRDKTGRVIGSAGLSVVPDRHQIDLEGRRFRTWCAYLSLDEDSELATKHWLTLTQIPLRRSEDTGGRHEPVS